MANQIRLKRASGSDPGASDLVTGEVAVRTDNGKLFTKKDDGNVVEVAGGISDGDKGDITVSNSGATFTIDSGVIDNANIASDAAISASKISGVMPTAGGTFTGNVSISDNAIEFDSDSGNTNKVSLQGPSSLSGNITLTLPNTDGTNGQVMKSDGNGNLSFVDHPFTAANQVIGLHDQTSDKVQRLLCDGEGLTVQGTSSAVSKLMFRDRTTANFLKFKPVDTLSAGVEFTLPSADGSANTVLKTDGSGVMSFGTIVNASVDASAAIAGTKISPDFGSQAITTTGNFNCSSLTASNGANINNQIIINGATPQIQLVESDANPDYTISTSGGIFEIKDATNVATKFSISGGEVISDAKLNCQAGLDTDGDVKFNSGTTNMNILFDASQQSLEFDDSVKATFGFDRDFQIYHDGSDNIFESTVDADIVIFKNTAGNSELRVQGHEAGAASLSLYADEGDDPDDRWKFTAFTNGVLDLLFFKGNTSSFATTARFTNDGGTELRHTNVKVFETTSSGVTVTGTCTATTFSGSGASLTSLNASNISSGTIAAARVATLNQNTTGSSGSCTGTAAVATAVTITSTDTNSTFYPLFTSSSGNQTVFNDNSGTLSYNPSSNTLTAGVFSGNGSSLTNVDAETLDGIDSGSFIRSDANDTVSGDITFAGGAAAVVISGGSDIRFTSGSWTGNTTKIQNSGNYLYIVGDSNGIVFRDVGGTDRVVIDSSGHFVPQANNTYDMGLTGNRWRNGYFQTLYGDGSNLTGISSGLPTSGGELTGDLITHQVRPDGNGTRSLGTDSFRWSNVYTSDLHLSNKAKGANQIDNTWGDFTIQEGANDLYLINNRNGKMFKFLLAEVN